MNSTNFFIIDENSTDIIVNTENNIEFLNNFLENFKDRDYISDEEILLFLKEIAQRVIWENIIEFEDPYIRDPKLILNLIKKRNINSSAFSEYIEQNEIKFLQTQIKNFTTYIPASYLDSYKSISIINAVPLCIDNFLKETMAKGWSSSQEEEEKINQENISEEYKKKLENFIIFLEQHKALNKQGFSLMLVYLEALIKFFSVKNK